MQPSIHDLQLPDTENSFRVQLVEAGKEAACILINSGRVSAYDGKQPEVALFSAIRQRLHGHGISTLELDLPERPGDLQLAEQFEINQRCERLQHVISGELFKPWVANYSILGLSLGGQTAVQYVCQNTESSNMPRALCLLSTIVENPSYVAEEVEQIDLVFGSRDVIAYTQNGEVAKIVKPEAYAKTSREFLVCKKNQQRHVHILPNIGHLLAANEGAQPLFKVAEKVKDLVVSSAFSSPYCGRN